MVSTGIPIIILGLNGPDHHIPRSLLHVGVTKNDINHVRDSEGVIQPLGPHPQDPPLARDNIWQGSSMIGVRTVGTSGSRLPCHLETEVQNLGGVTKMSRWRRPRSHWGGPRDSMQTDSSGKKKRPNLELKLTTTPQSARVKWS